MASQTIDRSHLLIGCGATAIAVSLALVPQQVSAQAFQATPDVVLGDANIDRSVVGQDTITANTGTVVIDWTPAVDNAGNALDFLPTGTTAIFQNNVDLVIDYAVLNRILPSANGNVAVIDGSVISRVDAGNGFNPGGFVAFYSPTGILVGANAVFDVGGLMLTALDPDLASFSNFSSGATLNLIGTPGSTARIQIDAGASIGASAENSFFIVAAPQIVMNGAANINGSTAYVAGERIDLTYSNGLFDIVVPIGTSVATAIEHNGTTTGPASSGAGDNHVVYGVAKAETNPIQMLFRGNLGFAPAAVAGVDNGDIILAANYDVFGRTVNGGSVDQGIGAVFAANAQTSAVQADITVDAYSGSSDLLAIGTHSTQVLAASGSSAQTGNLLVIGGTQALVLAASGQTFAIDGDVLVSATDYGLETEGNFSPPLADAAAGQASINANSGGVIAISGSALVTADAFAGFDSVLLFGGNALGGTALIHGMGGSIAIDGGATMSASASGPGDVNLVAAGSATGGLAQLLATQGGLVSVAQDVAAFARADGADVSASSGQPGTAATGGRAFVNVFTGGGSIAITGDVMLDTNAVAGAGNGSGPGADGVGGQSAVVAEAAGAAIAIGGSVSLSANGTGATNAGGIGGDGIGGRSRVSAITGDIAIDGSVDARGEAVGGAGLAGGMASGGIAGVFARVGAVSIDGSVAATATGLGGDASFGAGGQGGAAVGGNAFVQAEGTLTENGSIAIGAGFIGLADATGGRGGASDGSSIAAGAGGEARGGILNIPIASEPARGGGAFALAQGDRGTLQITGATELSSSGFGGQGGAGLGAFEGGAGGDGFGGTAQAGMFVGSGNGSVGQGVAEFDAVNVFAGGLGGSAGIAPAGDAPSGAGGDGFGGSAFFTARVSTATAGAVLLDSIGLGGLGTVGGTGTGGTAGLLTTNAGTAQVTSLTASADGRGSVSLAGAGATGTGGTAFIGFQGGTALISGNVDISASGFGGEGNQGNGGAGIGGTADIATFVATAGSATIGGTATVVANGIGGATQTAGLTGGSGTGGEAFLLTQAGGTLLVNTAKVIASGQGGSGPSATGGSGQGGTAYIEARDAGSSVTVTNAPTVAVNFLDQGSLVAANGMGGNTTGGSGIGGTGTGGQMTVLAANGGTVALPQNGGFGGLVRLFARGQGGTSNVEGGSGGLGVGGIGTVAADGGTLTGGPLQISVFAQGGASSNSGANIDGGDGTGGERYIRVTAGGTLTASFPGGVAGGVGGNASGTGVGGDGTGGIANLEVIGGTANLIGTSIVTTQNTGGNGATGGNAALGLATVLIEDGGVINIQPNAAGAGQLLIGSNAFGGTGTTGAGGNATGQNAQVIMTSGSITGGFLNLQSEAVGGASTSGAAGNAIGGQAIFTAEGGSTSIAALRISANARGGVSQSGANGNALAGTAQLVSGANMAVTDAVGVLAVATTGPTSPPAGAGGVATGGNAGIEINGEGSLLAGTVIVDAGGAALANGSATGGIAKFDAFDGSVQTGELQLLARATSVAGPEAQGGAVELTSRSGGAINAATVLLDAGVGGATANSVGSIAVEALGGGMTIGALSALAFGGASGGDVSISADNAAIAIGTSADVKAVGDIAISATNGALIGGPSVSAPTAQISLSTPGTISFAGNNDNAISFGGDRLELVSSNLDIGAGARIGAVVMTIESTNTSNTAILGGTAEGSGYTLTAAEIERIEAGTVSFFAPEIGETDVDILMRDMFLAGSLDDGPSEITLVTPGTIRVEGVVAYVDAGAEDRLVIEAGERLEIVTPGGIGVVGADENPSGTLVLRARDIWAADAETIDRLRADLSFEGRDDLLATSASGSEDPLGYLRGGSVQLIAGQSLLVRNTGSEREPGGILVGEGGLSINGRFDEGDPSALDVFAYGRQQTADGGFVLGQAFYDLINFNRVGDAATEYLEGAEFNDCVITTGECERFVEDIIEAAPPVNNPVVTDGPIAAASDAVPPPDDESDAQFGADFPGLVDAPLLSQETLLEDPVTSGGDSALYALDDEDDGEDDEDDEEGEGEGNED